jgi:hypothetical protein
MTLLRLDICACATVPRQGWIKPHYRKMGYSEFGHIVDYPPGHKRFFFQKRLTSSA